MDKLRIGLLLHFYQPWWQFPEMINKIANECYRPILKLIDEFDGFCFTANINLCLLEHLENLCPDVVEGFKGAVKNGKLELMSSTAQHPIMPLIPEFVQKAQVAEDRYRKNDNFGIKHNCKGFFLPEMAFSTKDIEFLKSCNCWWTVVDDEPFVATYGRASVPFNSIVNWNGFKVFMRSGRWSNLISSGQYSFADIKEKMKCEIPNWTGNVPAYMIIAMDAETFGHHHSHLIDIFLRPMLKDWAGLPAGQVGNKIVPIESLSSDFQERSVHYLPDGSWSTSTYDIARDDPYPLWSSKSTKRQGLWRLVNLALNHFDQAREDCLKMTSSCHWWWISRSGWEPDFMKKGANMAMDIIKKYGSAEEIASIKNTYEELISLRKIFIQAD